jgi:hypothetical protein
LLPGRTGGRSRRGSNGTVNPAWLPTFDLTSETTMAARSELEKWLQQSRKSWLGLTQGTLWLCGIFGGFLLPPPAGILAGDEKVWLRLGQFIVGVLLGLVFLATRQWKQPRHALKWGATALLFLVFAVAAFFLYQQLTLGWTGVYDNTVRVVVGSEFTPQGEAYMKKNPGKSRDELITDFTGVIENIWTRESINRRRLILAATYVSCLPFFTICLMAVVQAIQCAGQMPKRRPRR